MIVRIVPNQGIPLPGLLLQNLRRVRKTTMTANSVKVDDEVSQTELEAGLISQQLVKCRCGSFSSDICR